MEGKVITSYSILSKDAQDAADIGEEDAESGGEVVLETSSGMRLVAQHIETSDDQMGVGQELMVDGTELQVVTTEDTVVTTAHHVQSSAGHDADTSVAQLEHEANVTRIETHPCVTHIEVDPSLSQVEVVAMMPHRTLDVVMSDAQTGQSVAVDMSMAGGPTSPQLVTITGGGGGLQGGDAMLEGGPACLICGDKGSGYHYSVLSCEGCKGFFKRSVQKSLMYSCKEARECFINRFTRNNCQFCRFNKCLLAGMKREAVREDRQPGGKHRHKRPKMDDESAPGSGSGSVPPAMLPQEDYDEQLVTRLVEAHADMVPAVTDMFAGDNPPDDLSKMDINDLMQYGYMELRMIIEWARKVPGFSDLLIEDQMALLKASFMELNVLRLAYRSLDSQGAVRFGDSVVLTPSQSVDIGWGRDLITYTLDFISKIRDITMDNHEFNILNGIVLTYPDAAGVQDKEAVMALQSRILEALRKYSNHTYPNEPRRYAKILLRLLTLRVTSAKAAERFLSMSLDGSIKMNSLVLEMMS